MKKMAALLATAAIALSSVSNAAVNAAAAGDPFAGKSSVNIVYLGGSITAGAGVSDKSLCWVNRIGEYFKEEFPGKTINNYNAGLGGTGTDMGIMRLEKDVLSKKPDYVFIEFAVNDIGKSAASKNMESIVRSLQTLDNVPYVTFVYTARYDSAKKTVINNSAAHQTVADYYGIPSIEMKDDLEKAILSTGTMDDTDNVKKWLVDLTHPTADGYGVYYNAIKDALETGNYYKRPEYKDKKLDINAYPLSTKWVPANDGSVKATGTWNVNNNPSYGCGFTSTTAGDTLEYTFYGPVLGIQHRIGKECGQYKLNIDGKDIGTIDTYYGSTTSQGVLGYQNFALGAGEHRLKITVLGSKNAAIASGTMTPVAIDYFISESKTSSYKWINEDYEDCDFSRLVPGSKMTYEWSKSETANGSSGAMKVTVTGDSTGPNYRCETVNGTTYNVSAWIKVANIGEWKLNDNSDKVRFVFQPKVLNEDGSWSGSECYTECVVTDAGITSGDWVKVSTQYVCDGKGKQAGKDGRVAASDVSRVEIRLGSGKLAQTTGLANVPEIFYVDDFVVEPEGYVPPNDNVLYTFEDGEVQGTKVTGNDAAQIADGGVFGSQKSLKLSYSSRGDAGWRFPIYMEAGTTYNVSYYCKALDNTPLSMRPIIYIEGTPYNLTPNMTSETLVDAGNGWYYYKTTYTAEKTGSGTIELRKLSAIASFANIFLIDDIAVGPADKFVPGLEFTSELGATVTGTAVQYTGKPAIVFLAAYDKDGRMVAITTKDISSGKKETITLSGASGAVTAKLSMFDSTATLKSILSEVTKVKEQL